MSDIKVGESKDEDYFAIRVSLVVQTIDDFTNKPILQKILKFDSTVGAEALAKDNGYYVFVNLRKKQFELTITSALYHEKKVFIDLEQSQESPYSIKVRMIPNRAYPIPPNTTCIAGHAEPFSKIQFLRTNIVNPYKLLYEYDLENNPHQLLIYNPDNADLEGKIFYITDKNKEKNEYFTIQSIKSNNDEKAYILNEPLKESYKKIGTAIYPVYVIEADANGDYFLPISNAPEGKTEYVCRAVGNSVIEFTRELIGGKLNNIDFIGGE